MMDYNRLLDFTVDFGYELAMSGAEIFRVEESITRMFAAYGIEAEVFAIPNNLTVSIIRPDGKPFTRMRRIGYHDNDLDSVTLYNDLSRRICRETPDADTAMQWLEKTRRRCHRYSLPTSLLGYWLTSAAFCMFFGGSVLDALAAGLSGACVGLISHFLTRLKTNPFFSTLLAAIPLAFIPYTLNALGVCPNPDAAIIGAVMVLIPGLLFTTAMRDIIYGDTNSGINRLVQVMLIAVAIAAGTAVAWNIADRLWGPPVSAPDTQYMFLIECVVCFMGGMGFSVLYNIHGKGMLFCSLGCIVTWSVYQLSVLLGTSEMMAYLFAAIGSAGYSEIMARVRKCPAIGYLIISILILTPGSSLYYTIYKMVLGDTAGAGRFGTATVTIAGLMAAGILLVSTTVRMFTEWHAKRHK